jgi:hypothetical protein
MTGIQHNCILRTRPNRSKARREEAIAWLEGLASLDFHGKELT